MPKEVNLTGDQVLALTRKYLTAVCQRNLNFIQSCAWEARSRNNILIARDFLNNGVNQSGLAYISHADHINVTSLAAILNLVNQILDGLQKQV